MKRIKLSLLLLLSIVPAMVGQSRVDTLLRQLRDPECNKVFVVAHRCDWRNAPENSLQAIQNCIELGVDMIEIDLRQTKDGELILLHDPTLNRTTSGKGEPKDYTLAEIKKMVLKNGANHKTDHRVPTLREALELAKGKILVNVDKGYDYFDRVITIARETGTLDQIVIKENIEKKDLLRDYPDIFDQVVFMPKAKLDDPKSERTIEGYCDGDSLVVFEVGFEKVPGELASQIGKIKTTGAKIFMNALWPSQQGGHDDDLAVDRKRPDESWGWLIDNGASLIQTDRSRELLEYLRKRGRHE